MKWLDRWKTNRARKLIVTFHMKSGNRISVRCDEIVIKKNYNKLYAYEMKNVDKRDVEFYICLEQVEAISTEKV